MRIRYDPILGELLQGGAGEAGPGEHPQWNLLATVEDFAGVEALGGTENPVPDNAVCIVKSESCMYLFDAQSKENTASVGRRTIRPHYLEGGQAGRWRLLGSSLLEVASEIAMHNTMRDAHSNIIIPKGELDARLQNAEESAEWQNLQ